tara:strand:+ start:659 stop:910 length:252 start_codon:yes stop_codon:yes gene_type:complete
MNAVLKRLEELGEVHIAERHMRDATVLAKAVCPECRAAFTIYECPNFGDESEVIVEAEGQFRLSYWWSAQDLIEDTELEEITT